MKVGSAAYLLETCRISPFRVTERRNADQPLVHEYRSIGNFILLPAP